MNFQISPVNENQPIPDDAKCQEASMFSAGAYIPCGAPATSIVHHDKDGRGYYMCSPCADHNVKNRGGKLVRSKDALSEKEAKLQQKISADVDRIKEMEIVDSTSYVEVAEFSRSCKAGIKAVEEEFKEEKELAHRLHTLALDKIAKFSKPYREAMAAADGMLSHWNRRQEQIKREEEAKLQEQARKDAEQRAVLEAARLEKEGDAYGAQQVIQEAVTAPPPVVVLQKNIPKVQGTHFRKGKWKWRLKKEGDLSKIKPQFLMTVLDEKAISLAVERHKDNAHVIVGEGIEIYQEDSKPVHRV